MAVELKAEELEAVCWAIDSYYRTWSSFQGADQEMRERLAVLVLARGRLRAALGFQEGSNLLI